MAKKIKFEGRIHSFPDDVTEDEINDALGNNQSTHDNVNLPSSSSLSSSLKGAAGNLALGGLSQQLYQSLPEFLKGSFTQGFTEGEPQAVASGIRGLSELTGHEGFPQTQLPESQSYSQSLGRGVGKGIGYGAVAAPFIGAGEATLPGLAGQTLGAGLAGGLTHEGDYKDRLTNAFLEAAVPSIAKGLSSAGRIGLSSLKRSPTPRNAADIIQTRHTQHQEYATEPLKQAEKEAAKVNKPIRINKKLIDAAEDALANTKANKNLINKAKTGDYKSLFKLQADLGKRSRSFASKNTQAELDRGEQIGDLRDSILQGMKTHYDYLGKSNISKDITEGRQRYADFADLFLHNPTISKLVNKEKIVPKNLLSKIESDTAYFDKLRKAIPELEGILKVNKDQKTLKNAYNYIKRLGTGALLSKYALHNYDNQ